MIRLFLMPRVALPGAGRTRSCRQQEAWVLLLLLPVSDLPRRSLHDVFVNVGRRAGFNEYLLISAYG